MEIGRLFSLIFLLWMCASVNGDDTLSTFMGDIITTFRLIAPTVIYAMEEAPEICLTRQWLLCLANIPENDLLELGGHLDMLHRDYIQGGIILVGNAKNEDLVTHIIRDQPSIFTSNYPVLMPLEFAESIPLRLDSNIIFYQRDEGLEGYTLIDVFAVKGGPPITLELGYWEKVNGINLKESIIRWERRTDLRGSTIINALAFNGNWANVTLDNEGNVNGSEGFYPEKLFYMTDRLNVTVKTKEEPHMNSNQLSNRSFTGLLGLLQRKEADVVSVGRAVSFERSEFFDYPLATDRQPITLIAKKPTAIAPSMWVFVQVFGITQWSIFFALLIGFITAMVVMHNFSKQLVEDSQSHVAMKCIATAYLFTIQQGEHFSGSHLGIRLLTFTLSVLTLILFVYYTSDITAEMTGGSALIPVRTFDDAIKYDVKVITTSSFIMNLLSTSQPGTAKHKVFKMHFEDSGLTCEVKQPLKCAFEVVLSEPKTMYYLNEGALYPINDDLKRITDQLVALTMDDSTYVPIALMLQKESEFLQICNYYMLKGLEHGIIKYLYRKTHHAFFTKEEFGMPQPGPLDISNVIFLFCFLAIGISASVVISIIEFLIKKCRRPSPPSPPPPRSGE